MNEKRQKWGNKEEPGDWEVRAKKKIREERERDWPKSVKLGCRKYQVQIECGCWDRKTAHCTGN